MGSTFKSPFGTYAKEIGHKHFLWQYLQNWLFNQNTHPVFGDEPNVDPDSMLSRTQQVLKIYAYRLQPWETAIRNMTFMLIIFL
jgi:hypothetical protein